MPARNADKGERARNYHRIFDIGRNRNLYAFAACVFFFQRADASMLPLVGENLAQSKAQSASLIMANLIVVPQVLVAILSPWVGIIRKNGDASIFDALGQWQGFLSQAIVSFVATGLVWIAMPETKPGKISRLINAPSGWFRCV
jgi:hypothetical protein